MAAVPGAPNEHNFCYGEVLPPALVYACQHQLLPRVDATWPTAFRLLATAATDYFAKPTEVTRRLRSYVVITKGWQRPGHFGDPLGDIWLPMAVEAHDQQADFATRHVCVVRTEDRTCMTCGTSTRTAKRTGHLLLDGLVWAGMPAAPDQYDLQTYASKFTGSSLAWTERVFRLHSPPWGPRRTWCNLRARWVRWFYRNNSLVQRTYSAYGCYPSRTGRGRPFMGKVGLPGETHLARSRLHHGVSNLQNPRARNALPLSLPRKSC